MLSKKKARTAQFEHPSRNVHETYITTGTGIEAYYGY